MSNESMANNSQITDSVAVPAADLLPPLDMQQIKEYSRIKRWCHISGLVISIAYWVAWAVAAQRFVEWLSPHLVCRWVALYVMALIMVAGSVLVSMPLDFFSGYTVEKRFGLSNQTPRSWLVFQAKSWLVGAILALVLISGLYAALWYAGHWWGVYVWAGMMVLSVVLAKLFPLVILPLFYPSKPLERPSLVTRLTEMAEGAGMKITGVFDLALSKDTKKANAMLAGLGSTRRVYLSDTLVGAFEDSQIAVVFAHELGHHVRKHIFKLIGLSAVVSSILVTLIYWRLNPFAGGPRTEWVVPVARFADVMLIATVFPLLIGPIINAISRQFEREADQLALELTDDPNAYRQTFELLTRMNLADPDPPRWEEIMFDDHPALSKRIAMADRYESSARNR